MMKRILPSVLALALALTGFSTHAQTTPGTVRGVCGFDEQQAAYFAAHPEARVRYNALNQMLAAMPQQRGSLATPTVTIPVVVHIIHAGGVDNISDRQIISGIAQLNTDYQKLNADTASISPLFQPIAANLGFQFRLAKKDPNGNCTTGITRRYAPDFINDDHSGAVKNLDRWDTGRYLNIWVVSSIGVPMNGSIILGYSSFPGGDPNLDGFVLRHDYFGNQGTSSTNAALGRTATHEIGHYFGLLHPWGNSTFATPGNCGDTDFVADTPPTIGTYSCDLSFAPCGPIANVNNYMDYSGSCKSMFTQGQKARMLNVLSTIRTNLTTAANLAATGTNDGYVAPDCAPVAAFAPISASSVCVNTPVTLKDFSANFSATGGTLTYSWAFPGGTPATATGQTVTVQYPTAGFYSVTETVTNSIGSNSSTQTNLIRVDGPGGGEAAPYTESFESAAFPNLYAAPTLRNYTSTATTSAGVAAAYTWRQQASVPAADGVGYLYAAERLFPAGAISTLVSPNINLAGSATTTALRFARAYALRSATSDGHLDVSFSNDCGVSWSAPTVLSASALATQATPIDGFTPTSAADWQTLTVPIPTSYQGSPTFKFRLQMVNGTTAGNNFYLDYLRISGTLGTRADALASRGISVYPNPLTAETAVHLTLAATTQVQVSLTDVLGRPVLTLPAKTYGAGPQAIALQPAGHPLRAGVYVVRIALNGETLTSKLTVE